MNDYKRIDFTELRNLVTFDNQAHMDEAIYTHITTLRNANRPESTIEILRFFGRSSLRVLGVSFAKLATISKAVGYSLSTVRRAIDTLEAFGIIEKHATLATWHKRGDSRRKSVNVIVLQPVQSQKNTQDEQSGEASEPTPRKAEESDEGNEPVTYNQRQKHVLDTGASLKGAIPDALYNVLQPFFDAKQLYEVIGVLWRAKARVHAGLRIEENISDYTTAFLRSMRLYKTGQVHNLTAYLFVAFKRVSRSIYLREMGEIYEA